ncbi:hypothetical protein [Oceaniglobus roseus]|uniref:hypothetical protein n=1 Tax=Oceaniglobus roseus TaxID=1737570 RepID=UPI000C7F06A6|nr:hypothetical protein [Kandeliimicrobium roseum]
MTALTEYQRLEASGIWRSGPGAQRRDVIVSVGNATLAIYDMNEKALAHWSLAAVERCNPGQRPALYIPGPDADEMLEISDDTMIDAIGRVATAIARRRPRTGRLRYFIAAAALALTAFLAVFWLPGAMIHHTVRVVPPASRADIGARMLETIQRIAGRPCASPDAEAALDDLAEQVLPRKPVRLVVLSRGLGFAEHLPGGYILLNRALIEDFDGPGPVAGFILAEDERARETDPLERLLRAAGPLAAFRLLTTGSLPEEVLDGYAEALLLSDPAPLDEARLLARFAEAGIPSTAYAYALDASGEKTLPLIEGDPVSPEMARPIMPDGEWVALQGICGE